MRTAALICCLLSVVIVLNCQYFAPYRLGYDETSASLTSTDPLLALLLEAILFCVWATLFIVTLFRKRHRLWLLAAVVCFWPLLISSWQFTWTFLGPPGPRIAQGLRDRVLHDYTLDDLRNFAKDVDAAGIIKDGWINHGDISTLTDEQKIACRQLKRKYSFLGWLGDASILNYGYAGVVNFEWGGPLAGHWGCSIALAGRKNDPASDEKIIRASDDIFFYYEFE